MNDPGHRDPRGYILTAHQGDFATATKFINALIKNGIAVHRASAEFQVGEKTYPKGSYVVKCAQAFRPHIIDMFEPQVHPDDIPYPGGPPKAPYDSAGWTLAYQMGVEFDRILDGFDGPFERIEGLARVPEGRVLSADGAVGFLSSHGVNDVFVAMNRLLRSGDRVTWLNQSVEAGGHTWPKGTVYIANGTGTLERLQRLSKSHGLWFQGVASEPRGGGIPMQKIRVGLWDRYGGSMPSGWVRWLFERFEFDFDVVYPQRLDAGDIKKDFDVLVFVGGAISRGGGRRGRFMRVPDKSQIPEEYHAWLGSVTPQKTVPQLKAFLEQGGTILTIGSSTILARHLKLPIRDALTERGEDGALRSLPREKFFVPGSVLEMRVDNTHPLGFGLKESTDVLFRRSPVFRIAPGDTEHRIQSVAWFDKDDPLRSGWAWGQKYLKDGVGVVDVRFVKGSLFLFGPEITYRAQPHGASSSCSTACTLDRPARRCRLRRAAIATSSRLRLYATTTGSDSRCAPTNPNLVRKRFWPVELEQPSEIDAEFARSQF